MADGRGRSSCGAGPSSRWRGERGARPRGWTSAGWAATARTRSCTSTRARGKPLTAREAPRLLAWRAAYPFAPDAGLQPDDPPHATVVGAGRPRLRAGATRGCAGARRTTSARAVAAPRATRPASRTSSAACSSPREATPRGAGGGARHAARPAPLPHQPAPRARRARRGRSTAGRAGRCASRAASCCGCCTRASAARSPRATPTRRRSGPSSCATSTPTTQTLLRHQRARAPVAAASRPARPSLQIRPASRR